MAQVDPLAIEIELEEGAGPAQPNQSEALGESIRAQPQEMRFNMLARSGSIREVQLNRSMRSQTLILNDLPIAN